MQVKRIVTNIEARDPDKADGFYSRLFGLRLLMDHGWIRTYGGDNDAVIQLSIASEGGSDTPVPDISIEVDDLNEVLERVRAAEIPIEYGPEREPWGVKRFYMRDPFGKLINALQHE